MAHYSYLDPSFEVSDMLGKTFVSVGKLKDDQIVFVADNGDQYAFYHGQECCESVTVKDIVGELSDLEGYPLLEAEEVSKSGDGDGLPHDPDNEWHTNYGSHTWTFYKFATIKGHVNISWHGESNGYYSETVDKALVVANAAL